MQSIWKKLIYDHDYKAGEKIKIFKKLDDLKEEIFKLKIFKNLV